MKKVSNLFLIILVMNTPLTIYSMDNHLHKCLRNEVEKNNKEQVLILLEQKADPNDSDEQGLNPLSIAINNNNISIMKMLLDHKANPYTRNTYLTNCEGYNSQLQVLERVSYYFYSISPLMEAAKKGNIDCLKTLIFDYNVNIFFIDNETNRSFFEHLVEKNHLESTEMVLEYAKETDLQSLEKSLPDYFESLPDNDYKKLLCKHIIYCLVVRNRCENILRVPKPLYLHIIKFSINPSSQLYNLLELKRIPYLFSSNNVLALAQTSEMKNLLLKYYSLIPKNTKSEESHCLIV